MTALVHSSQSAPVQEYRVLWTAQKKQKLKRWHDGFLRLHTFNNRMLLYDDGRNLVADKYKKAGEPLNEGDELDFEQHLVTIEEFIQTVVQDLTPVFSPAIQRRQQRNAAFAQNTSVRAPGLMSINPLKTPITGAAYTPMAAGGRSANWRVARPVPYGQPAPPVPAQPVNRTAPGQNINRGGSPPRASETRPQTSGHPQQATGYGGAGSGMMQGVNWMTGGGVQTAQTPRRYPMPSVRGLQEPVQEVRPVQISMGPSMQPGRGMPPPLRAMGSPAIIQRGPPQPLTQETPTPAPRAVPNHQPPPRPPQFQPAPQKRPQVPTPARVVPPPPPRPVAAPPPRPQVEPVSVQTSPQKVNVLQNPPQRAQPPHNPPQRAPPPRPAQQSPPRPPPARQADTSPHPLRRMRPLPKPTSPTIELPPRIPPDVTPAPTNLPPNPEFRRPKFRPPNRKPTPKPAPSAIPSPPPNPPPPELKSPPLIPRSVILNSCSPPSPTSPTSPPKQPVLKLPTVMKRPRSKLLCLKKPRDVSEEAPRKRPKTNVVGEIEESSPPPSPGGVRGNVWNSQAVNPGWAVDDRDMVVEGGDDGYDEEGTWSKEAFCLFEFQRPRK